MYRTQYRNRIPQNKCIGLNTVTVFDNYSIKKQQIYVLDLFIPIIRKTNVSYTVFHKKKQELMYWISTRTYIPDSIIPIKKRKTNVSESNTVFHKKKRTHVLDFNKNICTRLNNSMNNNKY